MERIRILIAEDHKLIRETWSSILSSNPLFEIVASTGDAGEAVSLSVDLTPDIVLMDISMVPFDGFEATQRIKNLSPRTRVIGLSMHSKASYVRKMIECGAKGYLTKNASKDEMYQAIVDVHGGHPFYCQDIKGIANSPASEEEAEPDLTKLTARERQISQWVRDGYSSREIAEALQLSLKTVEVHRHNILKKLRIKNATSLVNLVNMSQGYKT